MSDRYIKPIAPSLSEEKLADMPLSLKHLDENGVFAGYASVFDIVDSQNDIIRKGAFLQSINARAHDIKLLWQHDMCEPIGVIEELREDPQGLYIKARLLMDVARAREAYALLKRGVVKGLSIGYSPRKYRISPDSGVRIITEVDLWEVSIVTFPANEAAQITVVKQQYPFVSPEVDVALSRVMQTLDSLISST